MILNQIILLAGGMGTRLREETEFLPKPLVKIGDKPIIWHIMKNLSIQGLNNFVISTGYKSEMINDYFINYHANNNDFTINLDGTKNAINFYGNRNERDWKVTLSYTGDKTNTGERVKLSSKYLNSEKSFMVTYGDGLANLDLQGLLTFHRNHGKLATITTVKPISRFGVLEIDDFNRVLSFNEKPNLEGWINMGFFVFEPKVLEFINLGDTLEIEPIKKLVEINELMSYRHKGFWQPMDTYREFKLLNEKWDSNTAPWKNWADY